LLVAKLPDLVSGVQAHARDGEQRHHEAGDEPKRRRGPYPNGAGGLTHGPRDCSTTRAAAIVSASFHGAATSCPPLGSPSGVSRTGTTMPGICSRLNHAV